MRLFCLLLLCLVKYNSCASQTYNLEITIVNIQEIKGYIQIGLYNNEDEFPKPNREYKSYYFKVTSKTMSYTLKNLIKGDYAIAAYHDENSDKICNRNFIGYPTENYGFSNNVRIFFARPTFKSALIELHNNKSIEISIN